MTFTKEQFEAALKELEGVRPDDVGETVKELATRLGRSESWVRIRVARKKRSLLVGERRITSVQGKRVPVPVYRKRDGSPLLFSDLV